MTQKPSSPAAASDHQDVEPTSPLALGDPSQNQYILSAAAAAARADDGMAGSSLRAEAETLSLLPGRLRVHSRRLPAVQPHPYLRASVFVHASLHACILLVVRKVGRGKCAV